MEEWHMSFDECTWEVMKQIKRGKVDDNTRTVIVEEWKDDSSMQQVWHDLAPRSPEIAEIIRKEME